MKKRIYYALPLIAFSLIFLATDFAVDLFYTYEKEHILNVIRIAEKITLVLFSAMMGSFSKTYKKFDYTVTALIPISFFLTLFVRFLFDDGCEGLRFYPPNAFQPEFYIQYLPIIAVMTATAFFASFKPIRTFIKGKIHFIKNQGGHE